MPRQFAGWLSLILLVSSSAALAQGRLERAREEVRGEDDSLPKKKDDKDGDDDHRRGHHHHGGSSGWISGYAATGNAPRNAAASSPSSSSSSSSGGESYFSEMMFATVCAPWILPRSLLGDIDLDAQFQSFPYDDEASGYLFLDVPAIDGRVKEWSARLSTNYGTDFRGLEKIGGRLRLDTTSRWGIDTEWDYRRERLASGDDQLATGDVNVVYRFAQSERAQFYTGLGVNWLSDQIGMEAGFNFTYGFDLFPIQPWVLSGSIDWGQLGKSSLFHGRGTVGVLLDRFELFTGYDYYNLEGVRLDGVIAGLQVYF